MEAEAAETTALVLRDGKPVTATVELSSRP